MSDNLRLLFSLYWRPRRTMGRILDEGGLRFGASAVLVVSLLLTLAFVLPIWATLEDVLAKGGPEGGVKALMVQAFYGSMLSSIFFFLLSIAFLYIPACILAATRLARLGSFGVAFRRDYGALLACALFSWAAALLPVALANLALPGVLLGVPLLYQSLLFLGGLAAFVVFMGLAVGTVLGVETKLGFGVALLGGFGLLFAPLAPLMASPFLLYIAFQFFHGDIADVQAILGRRRSIKRDLHAATVNPSDAEAQVQLGLLHLARRDNEEAKARFEKAVEINSREVDAHYQLGRLARQEARFADAIRHFEEVVRQNDAHARHEIWREIGATYTASTSWASARWALEKYTARRPHDPEGLLLLGRALSALGERNLAQEAFGHCIKSVDTMPTFRLAEVGRFKKEARKLLSAL